MVNNTTDTGDSVVKSARREEADAASPCETSQGEDATGENDEGCGRVKVAAALAGVGCEIVKKRDFLGVFSCEWLRYSPSLAHVIFRASRVFLFYGWRLEASLDIIQVIHHCPPAVREHVWSRCHLGVSPESSEATLTPPPAQEKLSQTSPLLTGLFHAPILLSENYNDRVQLPCKFHREELNPRCYLDGSLSVNLRRAGKYREPVASQTIRLISPFKLQLFYQSGIIWQAFFLAPLISTSARGNPSSLFSCPHFFVISLSTP